MSSGLPVFAPQLSATSGRYIEQYPVTVAQLVPTMLWACSNSTRPSAPTTPLAPAVVAAYRPEHRFWTTVGDLGYVDEDGYLYLTDRKSFMIISGGVNIYPQEVSNALALHPAVFDVAVIGVPHPEMGEEVEALVQLAPDLTGSDALADELINYVRDRIAHYKAPRSVDFVEGLPRTPTGKLAESKLQQQVTTRA